MSSNTASTFSNIELSKLVREKTTSSWSRIDLSLEFLQGHPCAVATTSQWMAIPKHAVHGTRGLRGPDGISTLWLLEHRGAVREPIFWPRGLEFLTWMALSECLPKNGGGIHFQNIDLDEYIRVMADISSRPLAQSQGLRILDAVPRPLV